MRLLTDPRPALQQQMTAATLALEGLPDNHSLRVAGLRVLNLAREIVTALPSELPTALSAAEKKQATTAAAALHTAARALQKLWQKRIGKNLPNWLWKNRPQTEADFFAEFWRQLTALPPSLLAEFFSQHAENTLMQAYHAWQALATRTAARQKLLVELQRAAAAADALAALTRLARLTPVKNGNGTLPKFHE